MKVSTKLLNEINLTIEKEGREPREYKLVLDLNAVVRLEEASGVDITNPANWEKVSFSFLTTMVWAALDTNHPEVTLREVRSWFPMFCPELRDLFYLLMGVKKNEPGEDKPDAPKATETIAAENSK